MYQLQCLCFQVIGTLTQTGKNHIRDLLVQITGNSKCRKDCRANVMLSFSPSLFCCLWPPLHCVATNLLLWERGCQQIPGFVWLFSWPNPEKKREERKISVLENWETSFYGSSKKTSFHISLAWNRTQDHSWINMMARGLGFTACPTSQGLPPGAPPIRRLVISQLHIWYRMREGKSLWGNEGIFG